MEKILDAIKNRRSIVSFSDREVEEDKLHRLFEAARWAPSSYNEQPWRFMVADKYKDPAKHEKMANILSDGNKPWAENAPVLILPLAAKTLSRTGKPNRFSWYDTGQAVAHLSLQATQEGLFLHQMGGFDAEKAKALFNIPDHFEPTAVIALGYKGEGSNLPDQIKLKEQRERIRKNIQELVIDSF